MTDHSPNPSLQDDCLFCMEHLHEAALGIVEPQDRPRLEHHLADCVICRAELAELDATVKLLPLAVTPAEPRAHVRHSLRQRLETELTAPSQPAMGGTNVANVPTVPAARVVGATERGRVLPAPRSLWALRTVAAGLLVALLAISMWTFLPVGDDTNAPGGQMSVLAMESSDNCDDCRADTRGHIGANLATTDGMVVAWNLDPARKHEVWCVNKQGERLKVGDLQVDASGTVTQSVSFPVAVGQYDRIYVARNDGTEELTVAPNMKDPISDPTGSPPA